MKNTSRLSNQDIDVLDRMINEDNTYRIAASILLDKNIRETLLNNLRHFDIKENIVNISKEDLVNNLKNTMKSNGVLFISPSVRCVFCGKVINAREPRIELSVVVNASSEWPYSNYRKRTFAKAHLHCHSPIFQPGDILGCPKCKHEFISRVSKPKKCPKCHNYVEFKLL